MAMEGNVIRRKRGRPRKKPKIEEEELMSYEVSAVNSLLCFMMIEGN